MEEFDSGWIHTADGTNSEVSLPHVMFAVRMKTSHVDHTVFLLLLFFAV